MILDLAMLTGLDISFAEVIAVVFQAEEEDNPLSDQQFVVLITSAFVLIGLYFLYDAREWFLTAREYLSLRQFDPYSDQPDDGLVAVSGTVTAPAETLQTPLENSEAVAYRHATETLEYDVELKSQERRRRMRLDDRPGSKRRRTSGWKTAESESDQIPFQVDTGSGSIAVDPDPTTLDLPVRTVDEPMLPIRLLGYLPIVRRLSTQERMVEQAIRPGDEVVVVGTPKSNTTQEHHVAGELAASSDDELALVTTKSRRRVALSYVARGITHIIPTIVLFVLAAAILALAFYFGVF